MSALKFCPFCGGEAETLTAEHAGGYLFCIMCNDCRSRGDVYDTEAEAVAAWNTRAERTCYDVNASAREHGAHCFLWRCSNCDESYDTEMESMNYCPSCGARVIKSDQDLAQEVDE